MAASSPQLSPIDLEIAGCVRAAMGEAGVTQAELSRRMARHEKSMSRWIRGDARIPGEVLEGMRVLVPGLAERLDSIAIRRWGRVAA